MTNASDQKHDVADLSATSQRMLALREEVFADWERAVRAQIEEAAQLRHPVLIDTLPVFYDNIAESLTPGYGRQNGADGTTVAAEHGGERARITSYDHVALIDEYQILRRCILEALARDGISLSHAEVLVVDSSIDAGIKQAVNAFTLVHQGLRERFTAALTHDLRGPLHATSMALEIILMTDDPARIRTVAAKALSSVQRMGGMVSELLDSMAFHGGQKVPLELSAFDICELVREVQLDAVAHHGLPVHMTPHSVQGWWDRKALWRAIENMLSNAAKYGTPGTPITIKIDEVHERLLLTVHNHGEPIPLEEQESIFQMYRRAEAARQGVKAGWGIGLPYVRAVAESHGGSVGVDSAVERGTTFVIDIPVDCRPFGEAPTLAAPPGQ
ncbi:HAMP domain-containing sensor histidine kinase [Massilia sp. YIM B02769]|uniref:sensor histidine kinase n=1 Tax=unclassified Massilia TaxID=2609279 RepID=UPI0025B6A9BD|nr:HAMP domain-containing sensor histidine kinase [Massilia sp.]MDN4060396.1 HAMP domain-containing sensor histidine kinase [Massilia sp. YIM B02769]